MRIKINKLTKVFAPRNKTGRPVVAVNDMTVEIPSGKLVGLLGPSGCGKSTTLFMLSGLETPTSGRIVFGDDDVTDLEPQKRGIGLVFQNYALYPHMTVAQNIMFPLLNMRVPKAEAKVRALEAAQLVQIEDLLERKPNELSGGQQQRVAIARALVKMPNVLLLDEPLSNLDARLRLQTREEIKRIQKETGITTVFVTHDQEEAMSICDIMVVMKLGVVQQVGEPQHIYDDPENLFVANFLGTPPINIFEGVINPEGVFIRDEKVADIVDFNDVIKEYKDKVCELYARADEKEEKLESLHRQYEEKLAGMDAEAAKKYSNPDMYLIDDLNHELEELRNQIARVEESLKTKEFTTYVGVRPEGFVYDPKGDLSILLNHIEVMGRDKSVVGNHENSVKPTVRIIIDSNIKMDTSNESLKFTLKSNKVFLFDNADEKRIRVELKTKLDK